MAAIAYDAPRPYPNTQEKTFARGSGTPTGTFYEADFVVLTVGSLALCSNNTLSVSGLADMNSSALFVSVSGDTPGRAPFGQGNVGTASQPFAPGGVAHFIKAFDQPFEISLKESYLATFPSTSQQVGISVDATSGLWIASTALSACATIIGLLQVAGGGGVGDTGARVIIRFNNLAGNGAVIGN